MKNWPLIRFVIISAASLLIFACAGKSGKTSDVPPTQEPGDSDNDGTIDSNLLEGLNYGAVLKCLTGVSRVLPEDEKPHDIDMQLTYSLRCSPIFSGESTAEVEEQLRQWIAQYCPLTLDIKNEDNCRFKPYLPSTAVSNSKAAIVKSMEEEGACEAVKYRPVGSLILDDGRNCRKNVFW